MITFVITQVHTLNEALKRFEVRRRASVSDVLDSWLCVGQYGALL